MDYTLCTLNHRANFRKILTQLLSPVYTLLHHEFIVILLSHLKSCTSCTDFPNAFLTYYISTTLRFHSHWYNPMSSSLSVKYNKILHALYVVTNTSYRKSTAFNEKYSLYSISQWTRDKKIIRRDIYEWEFEKHKNRTAKQIELKLVVETLFA